MSNLWKKLRHKFAMWIWRDDDWTKLIDNIECAVKEIRDEKFPTKHIIYVHFKFMEIPPSSKFKIVITSE